MLELLPSACVSTALVGYAGTTTAVADADNLTIADSGDCGITIRTGTTSTGSIYFSDATSGAAEADGPADCNQSSRYLRFATAQPTDAYRHLGM